VKLYLLGCQDILAGHLYLNLKWKADYKNLKSSGSKPSGGRDVAELGSTVVMRVVCSVLFLFFLMTFGRLFFPHNYFLLSCMHGMVEKKTYPENIYRQK
jgi:hypothetical protein